MEQIICKHCNKQYIPKIEKFDMMLTDPPYKLKYTENRFKGKIATKKGYAVSSGDSWEELFHLIFLNEVEPRLGRGKPTIIYEYPAKLAALARTKKSDPRFAERFEFYIEGLELGDAYSVMVPTGNRRRSRHSRNLAPTAPVAPTTATRKLLLMD